MTKKLRITPEASPDGPDKYSVYSGEAPWWHATFQNRDDAELFVLAKGLSDESEPKP